MTLTRHLASFVACPSFKSHSTVALKALIEALDQTNAAFIKLCKWFLSTGSTVVLFPHPWPPSSIAPHHPPHRSSLLTAQRANLRRTLAPALTHCQTKTEVILFSLTRVSEAWGKSHHPWRTTEGVREIAAYFLPEHAAGITDHAPFYPSIPSAVLPYVQYQRDQIHVEMFHFFPICRQKQAAAGASRRDIRQVEQPWGRTTFPARAPASLSDSSRQGKMMAMPASAFDFFFFKYISLLSHCFIDHRQNSLCPSATRTLGECSICNVITQMMMAMR